jgi:beta-glucosidase
MTLAACSKAPFAPQATAAKGSFKTASVPNGFMWGVSTAGYQWEGYDNVSQWAAWDAAGKTSERNPYGANGFKDYENDMKLARGLGGNTFRTSIEWARIEPQPGVIDQNAVAHYHRVLDTMKAQGLTPVITLHHFSHPQWVEQQGGWENRKTVDLFAKFAAFVAKEYGSKIEWYLTFNEPNTYLLGAYVAGAFPPGKQNPFAGLSAMRNMVRAHGAAYDAVHMNDASAKVSFNMYTAEFQVGDKKEANQTNEEKAVERLRSETEFMDEVVSLKKDGGNAKVDYAALDYYCKFRIKLPFTFPRPDLWEVYPEGMYNAIKRYHERYKLPVLIGENGMAMNDNEPRKDRWTRSAYLLQHLKQMQRAMAEGIPVLGYIHWSITDNYEWGSFSPRFGLFSVDCRNGNFQRVKADGADAFKSVIQSGGVTPALERRYPTPTQLPQPWTEGGTGTPVTTYR